MGGSLRGDVRMPPGALVGRDELVSSLDEVVRENRLVTLTGVGGVGKTRLAIEVAGTVEHRFRDGAWMLDLAAVGDGAAVPDAIATTLGITPQGDAPIAEVLVEAVGGRQVLLVLDNCEHVLHAVTGIVETMLAGSRHVTILATSRHGLGAALEYEVPVPPLDATDPSAPAVVLFVERARAVRPNFSLDDHPAAAGDVLEICRALDGLPLGIELAAARMAGMGLTDLRDRLGDRFRLLEGRPDAPSRQQSLTDLVRWSYELLDDTERKVLMRAVVFAGGFELDVFAGVYAIDDDVAALRSLDRLVRSSLVVADHAGGRARYRLLETIRQFGIDQLDAADGLESSRDLHARWFARELVAKWDEWNGPGWRPVVDWFGAELADLRAAFTWSSTRDIEVAADIAAHAALIGTSANVFEPINWAETLLVPASSADIRRLPRLFTACGYACFVGRPVAAATHADRAMQLEGLADYDGCEPGLAAFIGALANVYAGDLERYVELASLAVQSGGTALAFALPAFVDGLQASGRVDEALALLDTAVAEARRVGNPFWVVYALWTAGMTLSKVDPERALSAWDEANEMIDEHGVEFFRGFVARDAARLHTTGGDVDSALAQFAAAIDAFHHTGNVAQLIITLASVPALLVRLGRSQAAATLHAAMAQIPASVDHVPELAEMGVGQDGRPAHPEHLHQDRDLDPGDGDPLGAGPRHAHRVRRSGRTGLTNTKNTRSSATSAVEPVAKCMCRASIMRHADLVPPKRA